MEKNRTSMNSYASNAGYLISGALAGAVVAVFFAPKSGSDTREDVGYWIKDKAHRRRIQYRDMKTALASRRRAFRARTKELIGV